MSANNAMHSLCVKADRLMLYLHIGLFVTSLALASWYSTWIEAIVIGGGTLGAVFALSVLSPGAVVTRIAMGAGLMIMTSLHIHQAHGMIEFHFGVFVLLALLLYYRDWVPVISAAATIAVHHFLFYFMQTQGASIFVLGSADAGWWVIFLHAAYVVVETGIVVYMAIDLGKEYRTSAEIVSATEEIAGSDRIDLTVRTSSSSQLSKRFDEYTSTIDTMVQDLQKMARGMHDSSSSMKSVTLVVNEESANLHTQTDMIATAVEEMTAAINEVAGNAEDASGMAQDASRNAAACQDDTVQTEGSIRSLEEKIAQAAETIRSLDEQTNAIGSVLGVIRGIAEQTNLLALNAAIEAARAGEQGRGFAVVADEVRSLAQRTQQSTEEIDRMIEGLQNGSESAVSVIDSSITHVGECVERIQSNRESIGAVNQAIQSITDLNQMIAAATQQQSSVTEEISSNLTSIVDAAEETSKQLRDAGTEVESLSYASEDLTKLCGRFVASN